MDAMGPYYGSWRNVTVDIFKSVVMTEELYKSDIKMRHNVLQQMRDPMGIPSPLQKGRLFKRFSVQRLHGSFRMCKTKFVCAKQSAVLLSTDIMVMRRMT